MHVPIAKRRALSLAVTLLTAAAAMAADYSAQSTTPTTNTPLPRDTAATPQSQLAQVIIVYKTHFDLGYSALARDVVHEYRTEMTDRVLEAIEKNSHQSRDQQFVWTVSGWPMKQLLWQGQSPERKQKIEQAIRAGNLVVHAYPFTTHTETSEMEDLVRGLTVASTIARQFGLPLSTSAKMSDVAAHSWFLPTLFANAGIKFFHYGGPLVNRTLGLPMLFWWEGPDGSRLLTLYNNDYGSPALPPPGWPYKSWIYINMTGDNQGPPAPETVKRDIEFYAKRGIKARVGKMDDFAELILGEDLSRLPVVRSDMPDPWIHGVMSQPQGCRLAHNLRPCIGAADQLLTLEKCWRIFRGDPRATTAAAYEQSLLFSEHTWGLATQHYLAQPYGRAWETNWARGLNPIERVLEEAWQEHFDYIDSVRRMVTPLYADAVSTLADNVSVSGHRVVVYNPLPWPRDGNVILNTCYLPRFKSLKPADDGPALPVAFEGPALEAGEFNVARFVARDIPAMGYRTYLLSQQEPEANKLAADPTVGVIESPYFKATLDPKRGRIASLVDKRTGRELVDDTAPQGFGQYFYERFGRKEIDNYLDAALFPQYSAHRNIMARGDLPADAVYASALPSNLSLTVEKTPIDVSAVMTGTLAGPGMPQTVSMRLTLPADQAIVDLEVGWQKQPDGWPEAGWICLPFKFDAFKLRLGRLGADIDPVADITVDNVNYHQMYINTGLAVYDPASGGGVGICPLDAPLVSLGEPGNHKFAERYVPRRPFVFLNLYNNQWQTNFRNWVGDGSRQCARVRLWSFDRFDSESALYSPAMEARQPLVVARSKSLPGKLPTKQAGLSLSRKGVAITAFGPNPDGSGTLLRAWEQSGRSGNLSVTLPAGAPFKLATPVNLRGERIGQPFPVESGQIAFTVKAYAPVSVILE